MDVTALRERTFALCRKKGITNQEVAKTITAFLVMYATEYNTDPSVTLSLMEDDNNLTDISVLDSNFKKDLSELISKKLKDDVIFPKLFPIITNMTTRSIGVGEYALCFILANYKHSYGDGDGEHPKGSTEVKKDNSSLKVIESTATKKGLVDDLSKEIFGGTRFGAKKEKDFDAHIAEVNDAKKQYTEFFTRLYPGVDVSKLAEDIATNYKDSKKVCNIIGKFALKRYKLIDGWYNIIYINPKTMKVINISNVDDVDNLGLKFSPKFFRGGSTQAVADGHVDVKF